VEAGLRPFLALDASDGRDAGLRVTEVAVARRDVHVGVRDLIVRSRGNAGSGVGARRRQHGRVGQTRRQIVLRARDGAAAVGQAVALLAGRRRGHRTMELVRLAPRAAGRLRVRRMAEDAVLSRHPARPVVHPLPLVRRSGSQRERVAPAALGRGVRRRPRRGMAIDARLGLRGERGVVGAGLPERGRDRGIRRLRQRGRVAHLAALGRDLSGEVPHAVAGPVGQVGLGRVGHERVMADRSVVSSTAEPSRW